jgi:surface antigen
MRMKLAGAGLAALLALSACETVDDGAGAPRTQLSQCGRNALIGAAVGGLLGATQGRRENRPENAALGAALGEAATYGVCQALTSAEQRRVEDAYYRSLNSGRPVDDSWPTDAGVTRALSVSAPAPAEGYGGRCRRVTATVSDDHNGVQPLPPETFCRDGDGRWTPAQS